MQKGLVIARSIAFLFNQGATWMSVILADVSRLGVENSRMTAMADGAFAVGYPRAINAEPSQVRHRGRFGVGHTVLPIRRRQRNNFVDDCWLVTTKRHAFETLCGRCHLISPQVDPDMGGIASQPFRVSPP